MDDLITWLRACLVELENGGYPDQHTATCGHGQVEFLNEKCICGVQARVLREVEAKREIIKEHGDGGESQGFTDDGYGRYEHACTRCGEFGEYGVAWPCRTLRLVALPFSDRPGYREEWKP